MNDTKFEPVSNTKVIPLNGVILIKAVFNMSSFKVYNWGTANFSLKDGDAEAKFYIDGTSIEALPLGVRVILENRIIDDPEIRISDADNKKSIRAIKAAMLELNNIEREQFHKDNPNVELHEYLLVMFHNVKAMIKE